MKKAFAIALIAGTLLPSAASGAAPSSATATYVAAPGVRLPSLEALKAGVGGYQFTPAGDPSYVKVVDSNGKGILWLGCQEGPSQAGEQTGTCGDGDDISAGGCSNNRFQKLSTAFRPKRSITFFIVTYNPGVFVAPDCPQVATAGTITLKWSR